MKVILPGTDIEAYQKIFSNLLEKNCILVLWQLLDEGKRDVFHSQLFSFNKKLELLNFRPVGVKFNPDLPVYCYVGFGNFIFKTSIHSIDAYGLTIKLPKELKALEDSEAKNIRSEINRDAPAFFKGSEYKPVKTMAERTPRDQDLLNLEFDSMSLEEEDKLFASRRSSPRARPKNEKWVKVQVGEEEEIHRLKLYDLSRGGMSFVTQDNDIFSRGSAVFVVGFEEFDLDDPLVGQVMSLRPMSDVDEFEWKVGVKFSDGQS